MLLFSSHTGYYFYSSKVFLFSLRNGDGSAFKMAVQQGKGWTAMLSWSGYGPIFGKGKDLSIIDNCHRNTYSYSNLGYTYQLPAGYTYGTPQAKSLLAGSSSFKCDEYEVFVQQ